MMRPVIVLLLCLSTVPRANAQPADSLAARAQALTFLTRLAGSWRGESRPGNASAPVQVGIRRYTLSADSLQLAWSDSTSSGHVGRGILSYAPRARQFYYVGAYAPTHLPLLLRGTLDSPGTMLSLALYPPGAWTDLNAELVPSAVRFLARDLHTWSRWDGGWLVVYHRLP